jgi:hypothetical protein
VNKLLPLPFGSSCEHDGSVKQNFKLTHFIRSSPKCKTFFLCCDGAAAAAAVNIIIFFQTHEKFVLKHTKV